MKFTIENPRVNPTMAMRRSGYRFDRHVDTGEMSFVRELAQGGYPRFHMYIRTEGRQIHISIHIDHTKHTYGDATRHHGEYDNDGALGPEVERLKKLFGA